MLNDVLIRLALISGDVYAERVPGFWVRVEAYEGFNLASHETKIFLIQHALAHNEDFEWEIRADQVIG